ncbi:PDC sensor domain-containing protein [Celerinatantimonas sp. MCCC 1A17872]|uniref:PDC sensor domain-containing protein n=1 Tax=Celerinatantimonas sp. MCCC 1A17872 TaxID=3177514 RepID=UPI0038C3959B
MPDECCFVFDQRIGNWGILDMKSNKKTNMGIFRPHPKIEAILLSCVIVSLVGCLSFLIYSKSSSVLKNEIKLGLLSNVSAAATTINGDLHRTFNKNTSRQDPNYLAVANSLEKIREASHNVRYIYTNILKGGKVYFVVNPSPQNDNDGDGVPDLAPALMEQYENPAPELVQALKDHKSVVTSPYQDSWGRFISGYAPFYDSQGRFVGVLGMDLQLNDFDQRMHPITLIFEKTAIIVFFVGLIVGLLTWFSRRYTGSILLDNQKLTSNQTHFEQYLQSETGHYRQVIEAIGQKVKSMPLTETTQVQDIEQWISAWNNYFQSSQSKIFSEDNFHLDSMLNHIALATSDVVALDINQEPSVPNYFYGSSAQYETLLSELVKALHILHVDREVMQLFVRLENELVEEVSLAISVCVAKDGVSSCQAPVFTPDFSFAETYSVQQIQFFSTVARIEELGASIDWIDDKTQQGYQLTFSVSKYREVEQ